MSADSDPGPDDSYRLEDFSPEDWARFHESGLQDVEFVMTALESALDAGHPLDQVWIDQTAVARHAYARHRQTYCGDNGPTLESSRSIVERVLKIHLISLGLAK